MSRRLTIDFYTTEDLERNPIDITNIIEQAFDLQVGERRVDLVDSFLLLHNVRARGALVLGEIVKARMTDLPDKVSQTTGVPADLGLTADEGIGRHAHFLYDGACRVLLLQRDREVRHPAFIDSVARPVGANFLLSLIFQRDALVRLDQMRVIRKLSFKIARPVNPAAFRDLGLSASAAIDLLNEQDGRFIEISISVGKRRRASLARHAALQLIQALSGHGQAEVRKVIVSGRENEDGPIELIDLLEDRLVYGGEAQYVHRAVSPRDCQRILIEAHDENIEYLRNYHRAR